MLPPVQVWGFGGISIIMDVSTQLIRAQVSRRPEGCPVAPCSRTFETAYVLSSCAHHVCSIMQTDSSAHAHTGRRPLGADVAGRPAGRAAQAGQGLSSYWAV